MSYQPANLPLIEFGQTIGQCPLMTFYVGVDTCWNELVAEVEMALVESEMM